MQSLGEPPVHCGVLGLARAHMMQSLSPSMCIGTAGYTEEECRVFTWDQPSEEVMSRVNAFGHLVMATTLDAGKLAAGYPGDGTTA